MRLPDHDRGRPDAVSIGTAGDRVGNLKSGSSLDHGTDVLADLDALAEHLRGVFVIQTVIDDAGHRRTSYYRSAAAAERAVRRAHLRGRDVHVTLCQLLPVGVVTGALR